jgi:hypothetical protein
LSTDHSVFSSTINPFVWAVDLAEHKALVELGAIAIWPKDVSGGMKTLCHQSLIDTMGSVQFKDTTNIVFGQDHFDKIHGQLNGVVHE